ncbi:MAG: flagellar biosynthetic protein FliQ [Planctomyces sp.]|nr:flagellar biosynthetic protein FliQ [Planctomyces sp.]MBA4120448.1 flagellar biosynthetic protein FliQ [Isosphaera sp.]
MSGSTGLELVREALLIALQVSLPILLVGIVVGLVISVLQAITSIQDQALTFVPKIVAMIAVTLLALPWLATRLVEFASAMLSLR